MAGKWIRNSKRFAIYVRDNFTCSYCGIKCELEGNNPNSISLDHVIPQTDPKSHNDYNNLVVACIGCNSRKQDKPVTAIGVHPLKIELRVNKPIDHKLRQKFYKMPVKQARQLLMAMY